LADLERAFPEGEVYLVGGAVRDLLLGRSTKDDDFLVRGVASSALGDFLSRHGKVSFVGKTFGVYKLIPHVSSATGEETEAIDVALPRTERSFSMGGGYRDFDVQSDPTLPVEADLLRRDFTINAMAVDVRKMRMIDPFGGAADLAAGRLRAVGSAPERFSEDASRILRGLRFACQLGFQFEDETWQALCQRVPSLSARRDDGAHVVPRETVAREFIRSMVADPVRAFDLWDESGAFAHVLPELLAMKGCPQPAAYHTEGDVWTHTRLCLAALSRPAFQAEFGDPYDAEAVLAVLFHDVGKPATLQTPERDGTDRIRFNNHDKVGARMVREIAARLKLSVFQKGTAYAIDEEALAWLVEKHLLLVTGNVDEMRAATIEKHFLNPDRPGRRLLQLIFCDGSGTTPPEGVPTLVAYRQLKERLAAIAALGQKSAAIPPPLLTGGEVMSILRIPPGKKVGETLALLREEQLHGRLATPDDAAAFLKNQREGPTPRQRHQA
jgi:poly(A) polymerase